MCGFFFFSSRRRHTRLQGDWSSDVCSSDLERVLTFVNETFERIAKERGFYSDALMREIAKRGSLDGIPGVPEDAARIFKTSHEINHEWHVRHQAAFQRYTDNGVSKTINLPTSA